jgi:hypothetical protein
MFPKDVWNYILTKFADHETFKLVSRCNKQLRQLFIEHQKAASQIFLKKHPRYETEVHHIPFNVDFKKLIEKADYVSTFPKCSCGKQEAFMFLRMFYTGSWRNAETSYGCFDKDVELVCAQVNCIRSKAFMGLLKHDGDIVNAIMSLQFE